MKRLCAILLGLMMLAGLCACGRRTSPAPAPKTPEPVTVITPAQPAPSEAVPVSTPDGTTPLTAAELDWFGRCFFNVVPGWGPNRFLTCAYARPEDMDLAAVLACGPEGGWNVTSQERNMIAAGGTDSVVRIPLEQAQELKVLLEESFHPRGWPGPTHRAWDWTACAISRNTMPTTGWAARRRLPTAASSPDGTRRTG